jgi:NADP-dependent 3-hydroxy acid dehydrogenase YdfG
MKVLITGASKGFGFATANCYFLVGQPCFTTSQTLFVDGDYMTGKSAL